MGADRGCTRQRLARTKAAVTGIDFSKNSIDYARAQARDEKLDIEYVHQNYLEFNSNCKYDLIIMIFCDFCALSPAQRQTLLGKFKSLLKPNGSILMDVCSTRSFDRKAEGASYEVNLSNGFWSPEKYYCFSNTFKYEDVKVTLDKFTVIEKDRTRQVFNWLQHYDRESISREFAQSGLKIEKYLGNVAGDEFNEDWDEFAVIARAQI